MKCSIEYGIYIDSQAMKYVSLLLSIPLCPPLLLFLPSFSLIIHRPYTNAKCRWKKPLSHWLGGSSVYVCMRKWQEDRLLPILKHDILIGMHVN